MYVFSKTSLLNVTTLTDWIFASFLIPKERIVEEYQAAMKSGTG